MAKPSLVDTDLLLVQKLNTTAAQELYQITVGQLATYVGTHGDAYMADLSDQIDDNTVAIEGINESLTTLTNEITLLKLDVAKHDDEIKVLDKSVSDLKLAVDEINTKAKVNLNYRWVENVDGGDVRNIKPGEMYTEFDAYDASLISKVYYSTTDDDGYAVTQPYIFEDETLELTSAYDPSPSNPSKLRYRSIHLVTSQPDVKSNYIAIDVKTIHSFSGDGIPYYEDDTQFITRSDFYPNAIELEEFEQHVQDMFLPKDGSDYMTGDLTLNYDTATLNLHSTGSNSYIDFHGTFTLLQNRSPRLEVSNKIVAKVPIDAGGQTITNLGTSTSSKSAVTKGYVDQAIADLDAKQEDTFKPGDRVAKNTTNGVEVGGLALVSSTLYVRVS